MRLETSPGCVSRAGRDSVTAADVVTDNVGYRRPPDNDAAYLVAGERNAPAACFEIKRHWLSGQGQRVTHDGYRDLQALLLLHRIDTDPTYAALP